MKLNTLLPKKSRAQAMVEFAIVLPLLLLLLYGLLEAGRLLFMYSTIVTASRQAVRYGATTGEGTTPGVPRYLDCAGIRQSAQRVDFLSSFDDEDILIFYDNGPADTPTAICTGSPLPATWPTDYTSGNETRLIVRIDGDFNPIVPRIVPFIARTVANGNPIQGISARTILTGVAIEVTPPPGSGGPLPGTFQLSMTMNASPATYGSPGETIFFTYTLTNNGTVQLSGFSFSPTHGSIGNCSAASLAPGESMTCDGSYAITSTDVTNGSVNAQATATGSDGTNTVTSNTATATLTWVAQPQLQLVKSASPAYAPTNGVIQYTFTLTNSGNVALTSLTVSDPRIGVSGLSCASDLAPSASASCTANYTVTADDVDDNRIDNTATASATYGSQTVTSNASGVTVWTGPLFFRVSASPNSINAAGQTISYTYQYINNTGVDLYPPYTLSGYRGTENCSTQTGSIPVGGSMTCTGTYTVTQTDLNQNATLTNNTVRGTACTESGNCNGPRNVTSNSSSVRVDLVRNPGLSLGALNATYTSPIAAGTIITYTYPVTNTGNVTLSPSITDTKVTGVTCPALDPGATQNCTGTYTVTQEDMNVGHIANQATATATFNGETVSSSSQSFRVFTYEGPRLTLQVTPNPTSFTGVGEFIVYTYTIRNTGSVLINPPITVTDSKVTFIDCPDLTTPLDVGSNITCSGSYATTQADVDAGHVVNSASATSADGTTSNSVMAVVYVPGAPTLTPSPTPPATAVSSCGSFTTQAIAIPGASGNSSMSMTITNGNPFAVTVSNVQVNWNRTGGSGSAILTLQSARLNNTTFWTGSNNTGSLTITPTTTVTIPGSNAQSTVTFVFDRNYQTRGNPSITITLSTPGCESTQIRNP